MSFKGNYRHSLNSQGRVSLPARFRQVLVDRYSPRLVLIGQPEFVEVWPEEEYRLTEERLRALNPDKTGVMDFIFMQRFNLFEAELDGQGRILLPPQLREQMNLKSEVIFIGLPEKILMYEPGTYEAVSDRARKNFEQNRLLVAEYVDQAREK